MKTPQVKPDWPTGIYIGDGIVATEPISFRPMFEFASGEVVGNSMRFATSAEALGNARDKFMVWTMPTGYHAEQCSDPVNYHWSENGGTVAVSK